MDRDSGVWLCIPTRDAAATKLVRYEPIEEADLPADLQLRTTPAGPVVDERTPEPTDTSDAGNGAVMALLEEYRARKEAETAAADLPARVAEAIRTTSGGDRLLAILALRDIAPTRAADCVRAIVPLANGLRTFDEAVRADAFAALADLVTYRPEHARYVAAGLPSTTLPIGPDAPVSVNREAARCVRAIADAAPEQLSDTSWIDPLLAVEDDETLLDTIVALRTVAERDPERVRPSVTALLDALGTGFPEVRCDVLRTLGAVAVTDADVARRVVQSALPHLGSARVEFRRAGVDVLADIAARYPNRVSDYPGRLIPLLDDEDDAVRTSAAVALAALAPVVPVRVWPAMHRFVALLDDPVPTTRAAACRALGHIGATEAGTALRTTAERDPSADVREAAAAAVDRL